jgi:hypothetical protein
MKSMNLYRLVMALALLLMTGNPLLAQVYKVVDENGNVTYTDRPPAEGARPVELPPLSVVEAPDYSEASGQQAPGDEAATGEDKKLSLRTLRRLYRDFAIISPGNEESIWNPQQPIPVTWSVSSPLQPGMTVRVSIDGVEQAKTTQPVISIDGLARGEHTVTAELLDEVNRRIATAKPVIFFVQRPSVYNNFNRLRPTPRG